ncbi:PREDICTED: uncharacterized protein LOC104809979 isoform X2 [Tarenaya hassleriana]|uniref:uncharacterized protein LOC104809979 isoform X2 n=1 Tax=Tarenaya hassleriana TaxID=28532 RepID=UPI00053C77CB|nr:PREDICTED: uncharacterized protein LOC104809979 isoform X2 [Tarenaya hassleriana]
MIKRRFYRLEHGERDSGSDSSSFSSDSEVETEDLAESEDDVAAEVSEDDSLSERNEEDDEPSPASSGPVNADSRSDNVNVDVGVDDDDDDSDHADEYREKMRKTKVSSRPGFEALSTKFDAVGEKEEHDQDIPDCMIRCKSVFKCRYCPNTICLNDATMRAHVASKKHARSERLLKQGKSNGIDSDGEVDNQEVTEETHVLDANLVQKRGSKRSRRQLKRKENVKETTNKNGEDVEIAKLPKKKRAQTKG